MTDDAIDAMGALGRSRLPTEACGLLLPIPMRSIGRVIELPNRSMTPQDSYEIFADDAALALKDYEDQDERYGQVAIWHTHPSGFIGPSRADLGKRIVGVPYLVLALRDDGDVPTWF